MRQKDRPITSASLLEILKRKSERGIDCAKKIMQEERIESSTVREALNYYVSNWEISTHPAPFSMAIEAVGGNPDTMVEAQAAVVMLSAGLDLHDDIIDRSKTKHGKQTVFGKYGQDIALLLGNAFFVNGFTLLDRSATKLIGGRAEEVFNITRKGLFEVGDAHALELGYRQKIDADPEKYLRVLKMKAVTTEMSMQLGAILGGGTDCEIESLATYGRILGTLAALREEFIDVFEGEELHQRIQNECLPLPILHALQDRNSKKIKRILSRKKIGDKDVDELLGLIFASEQVQKLKKEMVLMIKRARTLLSKVQHKQSKHLLDGLVASMVENL